MSNLSVDAFQQIASAFEPYNLTLIREMLEGIQEEQLYLTDEQQSKLVYIAFGEWAGRENDSQYDFLLEQIRNDLVLSTNQGGRLRKGILSDIGPALTEENAGQWLAQVLSLGIVETNVLRKLLKSEQGPTDESHALLRKNIADCIFNLLENKQFSGDILELFRFITDHQLEKQSIIAVLEVIPDFCSLLNRLLRESDAKQFVHTHYYVTKMIEMATILKEHSSVNKLQLIIVMDQHDLWSGEKNAGNRAKFKEISETTASDGKNSAGSREQFQDFHNDASCLAIARGLGKALKIIELQSLPLTNQRVCDVLLASKVSDVKALDTSLENFSLEMTVISDKQITKITDYFEEKRSVAFNDVTNYVVPAAPTGPAAVNLGGEFAEKMEEAPVKGLPAAAVSEARVSIDRLSDLVASVRQKAVRGLMRLADADPVNRDAIREGGGISALIGCLSDADEGVRANAARALGRVTADNSANRDAIRESGGIPVLIGCLSDVGAGVCANAEKALERLAINNPANQAAIREGGGHVVSSTSSHCSLFGFGKLSTPDIPQQSGAKAGGPKV